VRILLFLLVPLCLFSQDLSDIDFSGADISPAGPSAFYIRGVKMGEQEVSLILKNTTAEGAGDGVAAAGESKYVWTVSEVIPESKNMLPEDIIFDFARITEKDGTIVIDGVVYNDEVYKGSLSLSSDYRISFSGSLESGSFSGASLEKAEGLENLLLAEEKKEHSEEIASYKTQLNEKETTIQTLSAEKLSLSSAVEELKEENTDLTEDLSDLQQKLDALEESEKETAAAGTEAAETGETADAGKTEAPAAAESEQEAAAESEAAEADASRLVIDKEAFDSAVSKIFADLSEIKEQNKDRVTAAEFSSAYSGLKSELSALRTKVGDLEAEISSLKDNVSKIRTSAGTDAPAGASASEELKGELAELTRLNKELQEDKEKLEVQLLGKLLDKGLIELVKPRMTRVLTSGFSTARPQLGSWNINRNTAGQTSPDEYFAKLILPAVQEELPTLYSFSVRSIGSGWVGAGLHFFVSDSDKKGYGLGTSLLLWLTRDPEAYKDEYTYLQLYRSDDDIHMGRVFDAKIEERLDKYIDVDIYYQPEEEYITVAINGEEKARYKTWFGIDSGVEIALRTLGTADFKNFQVRTILEGGE
jgi:peptidoglycan hydrolase CwlO-like protein